MLAFAAALVCDPRLMLLDEPSLGLSHDAARVVRDVLERVRDSGVAVLLVEHSVRQVLAVSKRVYVLNDGVVLHEGPAEDQEAVARALLHE